MIEKTKLSIKCLNISINIVYDFSTFFLIVFFFILAVTAKFATVTISQVYIAQTIADAQVCTFF